MIEIKLRDYQQRLIDVTMGHLHNYPDAKPIIVAPTASGKSVIVAALCERLVKTSAGMVLVLTHRRELVAQNAAKLPAHMNVGVYSAGLGRKELHRITVAGFQSLRKKVEKLPKVSYIIIDECHFALTGYKEFIDKVMEKSPDVRVIGLTATPYDGSANRTALHLLPATKAIFTGVGAEVTMGELLRDGYLTRLTPYVPDNKLDTTGVQVDTRTGDFAVGQLQAAVDVDETNLAIAAEIDHIFAERNTIMVFCTGAAHTLHMREALRLHGHSAEMILADTPGGERDKIIERFRAGKLRYLVACEVLLVGFDCPAVDGIANLRPTKSGLVWVQLCGRGMRLHPGKEDCIATGQRVLTDKGLVPIEQIDTSMKVWDGVEFVPHAGVIYKGEQEVIEYAGITGTPDHKVWTEEGWKTLRECAVKQIAIAVTGDAGSCVKQSDRRYRGGSANQPAPVSGNPLQHLWKTCTESGMHVAKRAGGLWALWKSCHVETRHAEMVIGASERSFRALSKQKEFTLSLLRWAWGNVSVFWTGGNGCLGAGEPWFAPRVGVESNRQQRPLRTGESGIHNTEGQYQQQSIEACDGEHAQVQTCAPGNQVRGQHACQIDSRGVERSGNHREVSQEIVQTKRGVWDILNAGPRHRFTCEGLLVSNCLVADFTDTSIEIPPLDEIEGNAPKLKGGEAPTKICDDCFSIILAGLKFCPVCGHEFIFAEHDNRQFDSTTGLLVSGVIKNPDGTKTFPVSEVLYEIRTTQAGAPAFVAKYMSPGRAAPVATEWLNIWHHSAGVANRDAGKWLRRQKFEGGSVPVTAAEALARAEMGALRQPKSVTVRPGSPYPIRFSA